MVQAILFSIGWSIFYTLVMIPFSVYRTFVIEEKAGFNKMTPKIFVIDKIKMFLV